MIYFKKNNSPVKLTTEEKLLEVEKEIQQKRIKLYIGRKVQAENIMGKLYGIVVGQFSQSILSLLQNDSEYKEKDEKRDVLWLLSKVKEITSGLDSNSNKRSNLHDALLNLTKMYQSKEETDDDYMKRFKWKRRNFMRSRRSTGAV